MTAAAPPPPPKISVKVAFRKEGLIPLLCEIDLIQPLIKTIEWVAEKWEMSNCDDHVLYVTAEPENNNKQWIVTNENKLNLKAGSILCLMPSPLNEVDKIMGKLSKKFDEPNIKLLLDHLMKFSADLSYAKFFLNKDGLAILTRISFEELKESDVAVSMGLKSLANLFSSMLINIQQLPDQFLTKIETLISTPSIPLVTLASLYSLVSTLLYAFPELYEEITSFITHIRLLDDFSKENVEVMFAVLSCLNAIFVLTPNSDKMALKALIYTKEFRESVYAVLKNSNVKINDNMQKQIKMLEYIVLFEFYVSVMTKIDDSCSKEYVDRLKAVYKTAFPNDDTANEPNYQKLGCQQNTDPLATFKRYPGHSTFICIEYLAKNHPETLQKIIAQQQTAESKSSWSFVLASSAILKEIITYFRLSESITFTYNLPSYHVVVFSCENFLQELYVILIEHFSKMWATLKSGSYEFNKVVGITKEQLKIALSERCETIDSLKEALGKIDPSSVLSSITIDRGVSRNFDTKHPTIKSMKEFLRPKIISAIHKQRLLYISDGAVFLKAKSKRGSVFCCYHGKTESIYFGDSDCPLAIEDLHGKISCAKMTAVNTSDVGTISGGKGNIKKGYSHAFSIVYGENDETLDLAAKSQVEFDYWMDGLNILMGKPLNSNKYVEEYSNLMDLSLRITLIDLEDVELAESIPPIPPLPPAIDGKLLRM